MIIKKIMVYNFKNFNDKIIFEFDKNINFLTGPNGFGKTTIYDALELGITGSINRIEEKKVTSEKRVYSQPFFQNNQDKDVVIKVWLEKDDESLIIIRHYEALVLKQSNKYAPRKSFLEISCYRGTKENFKSITIEDRENLKQEEIDSFFGFNESNPYEIKKVYPLFNYIQQEEIHFFMKKNESERKDSLGFLLKTEQIDEKIARLEKVSRGFDQSLNQLKGEKKTLESTHSVTEIEYKELFKSQEIKFDQKNLPLESKEILNKYLEDIDSIIKFKSRFSITEYRKKGKREKLRKIVKNNDLFIYFTLKSFLENDDFIEEIKLERLARTDEEQIEYYLFKKYINKFEVIKSDREKLKTIDDTIKKLKNKKLIDSELKRLVVEQYNLLGYQRRIEEVQKLFWNYYNYHENIDELEESLSELSFLREKLKITHENCNSEFKDSKCPFCGRDYKEQSILNEKYKSVTNTIKKMMNETTLKLSEISSSLKSIISELIDTLEENRQKLYIIDDKLYNKIELWAKTPPILVDKTGVIIKMISSMEPINSMTLNSEIVNDKVNDIKYKLEKNPKYDFIEYGKILKLKESSSSYNEIIDNVFEERHQFENIAYKKKDLNKSIISIADIESKISAMKNIIKNKIDSIQVNLEKTKDPQNILINYFEEDITLLNKVTIENLLDKKKYLLYIHARNNNKKAKKIISKIEILNKARAEITEIMKIYIEEVAKYKNIMVDLLKLPFYIYTAKILQNYQQGMGIFMVSTPSSEINFLADPLDGNDIMYQLSSGQLAVVSLAFSFALNTTFKLSDNLNFLVIDDPIQDMDAMNMGSLVEIIRQSIINRYQIIISTHNDNDAIYMSYKISMLKKDISKKYINLKDLQE